MPWKDEGVDGISWDGGGTPEEKAAALGDRAEAWLNDVLSPLRGVPVIGDLIGDQSMVDAALQYADLANTFGVGGDAHGALITAAQQYRGSTCVTRAGRMVDTFVGTVMSVVQTSAIGEAGDKIDGVVGLVFEKALGVSGISIGDTLSNSVHSAVALGEGMVLMAADDDTRGVESFHQKSLAGEYGPLFKAASEAGKYYAKDTGRSTWDDLSHAVGDMASFDQMSATLRESTGLSLQGLGIGTGRLSDTATPDTLKAAHNVGQAFDRLRN
jgi:hypothetical protein